MKFICFFLASFLCLAAFSTPIPFDPKMYSILFGDDLTYVPTGVTVNGVESGSITEAMLADDTSASELNVARYAKVTYDYDVIGNAQGTVTGQDTSTGVSLPANSVITGVWYVVETTIVSADDNTLALWCEASGDMIVAADFTDTATSTPAFGAVSDTGLTYSNDGCTLYWSVSNADSGITAGKLVAFIRYFVAQ